MRLIILRSLNGTKRQPLTAWNPELICKFESGIPRIDDLEELVRNEESDVKNLPLTAENNMIFSETDVPPGSPTLETETMYETNAAFQNQGKARGSSASISDDQGGASVRMDQLAEMMKSVVGPVAQGLETLARDVKAMQQEALTSRMAGRARLLTGPTGRDAGSSVFDDLGAPAESESLRVRFDEAALDDRFRAKKPSLLGNEQMANERMSWQGQQDYEQRRAAPTAIDELAEALKRAVAGNSAGTRQDSLTTLSGWKCKGAAGQMAWNELQTKLTDEPAQVINEFDQAVRRLSLSVGGANGRPSAQEVMDTWRQHAPLKENKTLIRTGEVLIHILAALRSGNVALAEARVVLALATTDQAGRDHGRFHRAHHLSMLAEHPFHLYQTAPPLMEGSKTELKIGGLGQFCSLERATVALAIYRDNAGTHR